MRRRTALFLLPLLVPLLAIPAAAQPVADFYRGKTITMATGTSPGGDYDLRLRMVARHIGKHIPGNPTVTVINMPGGGGLVVANWLANIAPKDGSAVVAVTQNLAVHQATGAAGIKFDVREFNWIGNTTDTPNVITAWHATGIRTIQDVMERELVVGATGRRQWFVPLSVFAQSARGHEIQDRHRLSRRQRRQHRDGAWRSRRPRLEFLGGVEIDAPAMGRGKEDFQSGAGRRCGGMRSSPMCRH